MGLELIKRPFGSSLWENSAVLLFAHKGMSVGLEFKKMREGERKEKEKLKNVPRSRGEKG